MNTCGIGSQQESKEANKCGIGSQSAKKIPCQHCDSLFTKQKNLNKHMKKYHANEWIVLQEKHKQALLDSPYECDVCHEKFLKNQALRDHRKLKHDKGELFRAKI